VSGGLRLGTGINPAWWAFMRNSIRQMQIYRFQYLTQAVVICVQVFLLRTIWTAVYDGRDSVEGVSPETLLVFITISTLQAHFGPNQIAYAVQVRIETGQVANDLIRPFGFHSQMIATQCGRTAGRLTFLIVGIPAVTIVGSLQMPEIANLTPYFLSLLLAYIVNLLTWLLVGLLSFWMMHVNGVRAMLGISSDFLAGAVVPLWFMPDALRTTLEFLPFQAGVFLPASIFAGQVTGSGLIRPFVVQIVWIVLLSLAVRLAWQKATRRIVVQGG
jgi:ABC-type uncharacterized transport system permease subunit